jgi:hypothetical protein
MKLACNGTTRDWIFSVACRVFLIQVLEVKLKILRTKKYFRYRQAFVLSRLISDRFHCIRMAECTPHYTVEVSL